MNKKRPEELSSPSTLENPPLFPFLFSFRSLFCFFFVFLRSVIQTSRIFSWESFCVKEAEGSSKTWCEIFSSIIFSF